MGLYVGEKQTLRSEKYPQVRHISFNSDNELPIIEGEICGKKIKILVDTGSCVSLLKRSFFESLKDRSQFKAVDSEVTLRTIAGENLPVIGCYETQITIDGRPSDARIYIPAEDFFTPYEALVGVGFLRVNSILFNAATGQVEFLDRPEEITSHQTEETNVKAPTDIPLCEVFTAMHSSPRRSGAENPHDYEPKERTPSRGEAAGDVSVTSRPKEGATSSPHRRKKSPSDPPERRLPPATRESSSRSSRSSSNHAFTELRLLKKASVPPHSESIIFGGLKSPVFKPHELLYFQPTSRRRNANLLIAHSVNTLQAAGEYPVRVANLGDSPIHLNKNMLLCKAEPLEIRDWPVKTTEDKEINGPISENDFDLQHLTEEERIKVLELIERFRDVFARDSYGLQGTDLLEHEIHLTDSVPVRESRRYVPHHLRGILKEQIAELLESEIITPSKSAYGSPIVLIRKRDNTYRFCIDFRKLNQKTVKDSYPLPHIGQTLDLLHGSKYFTTLDLTAGFHQIPIRECDRHKTAFICDFGLFQFSKLPFGLVNGPASFERTMDTIFSDLREDRIFVYVDDILCASPDLETHLAKLEIVFKRLRKHGLKIKPNKCRFLARETTYLGHKIDHIGIRPDPRNLEAVRNFPVPKSVKQVRSFVGLASFYRRHVKDFTTIALPLTNLTRKNVKFVWDDACQRAFEQLKNLLLCEPVLAFPDFSQRFFLTCDASNVAIAGILEQEGDNGVRHPIAYYSRKLNPAEKRYSTVEQECLALVSAVAYFKVYLVGRPFTIFTDHRPLRWLLNSKTTNSRLARWSLSLSEYDFDVQYRPGKANSNADALSRQIGNSSEPPCLETANIILAPNINSERLIEAQRSDDKLKEIIEQLEHKEYKKADKTSDAYFLRDKLLYHFSLPAFNSPRQHVIEQLVVPESLKSQILFENHDMETAGHFGFDKTLSRIRHKYFWLNMYSEIRDYVDTCKTCQQRRGYKPKHKAELVQPEIPPVPWLKLALDLTGPLPVTERGNRYLLAVIDYFTKYAILIPLPDQTAQSIATALVEHVFTKFGAPQEILTDRGTNFLSALMQELYKSFHVTKLNTTAFHPSSDGLVERLIATLSNSLAMFCSSSQNDWDTLAHLVAMGYNSTVQTSTNESPSFLLFGRDLSIPGSIMMSAPSQSYADSQSYIEHLVADLQNSYQIVRENLQKASDVACQYRKKTAVSKGIHVGDLVYLHDPSVPRGKSRKLTTHLKGPYRVIAARSPVNFEIRSSRNPRRSQIVHVDRLVKFKERKPFDTFQLNEEKGTETPPALTSLPRDIVDESSDTEEGETDFPPLITYERVERTPPAEPTTSTDGAFLETPEQAPSTEEKERLTHGYNLRERDVFGRVRKSH